MMSQIHWGFKKEKGHVWRLSAWDGKVKAVLLSFNGYYWIELFVVCL